MSADRSAKNRIAPLAPIKITPLDCGFVIEVNNKTYAIEGAWTVAQKVEQYLNGELIFL